MESIKTAFGFSRRIGNTRYRANVYQAPEATESFEDKIMRLIQRETLDHLRDLWYNDCTTNEPPV